MEDRLKRFSEFARYKADVLLNKVDFDDDINCTRKKWDLPAGGFASDAEAYAWLEELRVRKYQPSKEDVQLERQRLARTFSRSPSAAEADKLLSAGVPVISADRALNNDIGHLLEMYGLSYLWFTFIQIYILTGRLAEPPTELSFRYDTDELAGQERMIVAITSQTTKEDLMALHTAVQEWQRDVALLAKRRAVPSSYERDKRMYQIYKETGDIKRAITYFEETAAVTSAVMTEAEAHRIISRVRKKYTSKKQY